MSTTTLSIVTLWTSDDDAQALASVSSRAISALGETEIVCVDASLSGMRSDSASARAPHMRLVRVPTDTSPLNAYQAGIEVSHGKHIVLLHSENALHEDAAINAYAQTSRCHGETGEAATVDSAFTSLQELTAAGRLVHELIRRSSNPEPLADSYATLRRVRLAEALRTLLRAEVDDRAGLVAQLGAIAEPAELVAALGLLPSDATMIFAETVGGGRLERESVRNVVLTTDRVHADNASTSLLSQAADLVSAGFSVTVVAHRHGSDVAAVPAGVDFLELTATDHDRLMHWDEMCRVVEVDLVIDHRVGGSHDWPYYALIAQVRGAATIGWLDSASDLRSAYDRTFLDFMLSNANLLARLIVSSALHVAFWKLHNVSHVAYLPLAPHAEPDDDSTAQYRRLVSDTLPVRCSPEPTLDDARALIDLLIDALDPNRSRDGRATTNHDDEMRADVTAIPTHTALRVSLLSATLPIGEAVLDLAPRLRPLARAVKHRLLRR